MPDAVRADERSRDRVSVLVVDNSARYRTGLARALARCPEISSVIESVSGAAAIPHLQSGTIDVALVDAKMPGIDGLAIVTYARSDPGVGAIPVIVMSADDDCRDAVLSAGAWCFLSKLSTRREICSAVIDAAGPRSPRSS